jgi:hypothetical protein
MASGIQAENAAAAASAAAATGTGTSSSSVTARRPPGLVVVATLVDKIPNLAVGLYKLNPFVDPSARKRLVSTLEPIK